PFTASLLLVKSDWSQSPFAKRVEQEMRKAAESADVAKELIDKLPASGCEILFSPEIAAIYSKEDFAELLEWLKRNGLVERQSAFDATPLAAELIKERGRNAANVSNIEHAARRTESADIARLSDLPLLNRAFVSQWAQFE